MSGSVTISIWVFVVLVLFAVLAVLDRILIPSTRWFLRRRINRVIDEISTRLSIDIRPFQITKRQVLVDRLAFDPEVVAAAQAYARENDMPIEMAQKEVLIYAREIVPSFNAYFYFRIGYWVAKKVARLIYRVRVGLLDDTNLYQIDPNATVVFVMNHRSNMDYVLVAFLVAERTTLSYAVGEWAKIWPLHTLIRAMGAFFVRRKSGNPLYRRVLERYIHMATREGVCQAAFLEGGLTRDGKLRPPRLGLVDYMLRHFNADQDRDIVFIPVGINYDRTIEDRSLLRALEPEVKKRSIGFVVWTTFRFLAHTARLMVLSRWQRYGYACVNFGPPLSMKEYCRRRDLAFNRLDREERFPQVEKVCDHLMKDIARVIPILPVSLVATVMLESDRETPMTFAAIETRAEQVQEELLGRGAPVLKMARSRLSAVIAGAVDFLLLRNILEAEDDTVTIAPGEAPVLTYYANAIAHWREKSPR